MSRLKDLENQSIYLLREAASCFTQLGMLWSIGKDSTVMLWLTRKAFFGRVPFPLIHVDTSFKIPEMIVFRDKLAMTWRLPLIVGKNEAAISAKQTFPDGALDRLACCSVLKTKALRDTISGEGKRYRLNLDTGRYEEDPQREPFKAIILGIRADEEGSRSKERHFSPRAIDNLWHLAEQPPELWNYYHTDLAPGTHVRIHPLLEWTERDIWEYIAQEHVPVVDLYFDHGRGSRYRSLGCAQCTLAIASNARTAEEVVAELTTGTLANLSERSGRAQDKDDAGGLETLRRGGYM